jgi:hypothetical protein
VGYKVVADTDPLVGANPELLKSEVKKTTEVFEHKLSDSGRRAECEKKNVSETFYGTSLCFSTCLAPNSKLWLSKGSDWRGIWNFLV